MKSVHGVAVGLDVHKKSIVVVILHADHPEEDYASGVFGTTRFGFERTPRIPSAT